MAKQVNVAPAVSTPVVKAPSKAAVNKAILAKRIAASFSTEQQDSIVALGEYVPDAVRIVKSIAAFYDGHMVILFPDRRSVTLARYNDAASLYRACIVKGSVSYAMTEFKRAFVRRCDADKALGGLGCAVPTAGRGTGTKIAKGMNAARWAKTADSKLADYVDYLAKGSDYDINKAALSDVAEAAQAVIAAQRKLAKLIAEGAEVVSIDKAA